MVRVRRAMMEGVQVAAVLFVPIYHWKTGEERVACPDHVGDLRTRMGEQYTPAQVDEMWEEVLAEAIYHTGAENEVRCEICGRVVSEAH